MSTGVIVAIVVAAVVVAALVAIALPRSRERRAEEHLARRREAVAGAHREAAEERFARADVAEREAQLERAEAELHESRAQLHDHGLADEELGRSLGRFARGRDQPEATETATESDARPRDAGR